MSSESAPPELLHPQTGTGHQGVQEIPEWSGWEGTSSSFHEGILPPVQPEPPLAEFGAISSCPVICYLGEDFPNIPKYLGTEFI